MKWLGTLDFKLCECGQLEECWEGFCYSVDWPFNLWHHSSMPLSSKCGLDSH